MADLTITVGVTTGTQYVTGSTGSIYTFDGSQPASFTFPWVASGTVRLDQSASSNDGHPLIFSTSNSSTLGTMQAGIISSGVTYYLDGASNQSDYTNTTNFNAATTRYIEIAPASETDFYFACWVHGIGMGGIMNMTQDTWGALSWSQGNWGEQNDNILTPSGFSITSTLNSDGVLSYPEQGWGRSTWGSDDWGDFSLTYVLTGLSITATLNDDVAAFPNTGWGRDFYGEEPWGDSYDPVITLESLTAMSMSLGTFPYAQSEEGWGRDEWGYGNWGENTTTVTVDGFGISTTQGPVGWGEAPWNEQIGWGGELRFDTTQLSIVALTGLNVTSTLGTPTLAYDYIFSITGPSAIGTGLGTPSINNGADHSQGLASFNITSTLNSSGVAHTMTYEISGLAITSTLDTDLVVDNAEIVNITGLGITSALNSSGLTIADMAIGLSTLTAISSSVGAISPADVVGLTGLSFNVNLGSTGVAPLGYKDIDITGNTSYTYVEHSA